MAQSAFYEELAGIVAAARQVHKPADEAAYRWPRLVRILAAYSPEQEAWCAGLSYPDKPRLLPSLAWGNSFANAVANLVARGTGFSVLTEFYGSRFIYEDHWDQPLAISLEWDDGGWFVEMVGFPGCMSQGDTLAEATSMILEAFQLWLEIVLEDLLEKYT